MDHILRERAAEYDAELRTQLPSYLNWVFQSRYFPEGLLPISFQADSIELGGSKLLDKGSIWRLPLKVAPPDNRMTSEYFGVYQPDALHDFFHELAT